MTPYFVKMSLNVDPETEKAFQKLQRHPFSMLPDGTEIPYSKSEIVRVLVQWAAKQITDF